MHRPAPLAPEEVVSRWDEHALEQRVLAAQQVPGVPPLVAGELSRPGADGGARRPAARRGGRDLDDGVVAETLDLAGPLVAADVGAVAIDCDADRRPYR